MRKRLLGLLASFIIAAVLAGPDRAVAAEGETGGAITITLPAELGAAERRAMIEALESLDRPVSVMSEDAPAAAGGAKGAIATAMERWDAALAASRELPALLATWWRGLSAAGDNFGSLAVLVAIAAAILVGIACEWGLHRLLQRWRRRCLEAVPARFSERFGWALIWIVLDLLGVLAFAAGVLLVGWLLLPALETPRLTLAVVVAATVKARLTLAIARFVFAPRLPSLRLVPVPDADAATVWRWVFSVVTIIVVANGARDLMLSAGASKDSVAFLGVVAVSVAALVRLVAINAIRRPIQNLILSGYARQDGTLPAPARLFANAWHILFSLLVILDFAGSAYAELTSAEAAFSSLAIGSFLVLSLAPFAIAGYGALIDDLLLSRGDDGRLAGAAGALKALGQGAIVLVAFAILAGAWGADPFAGAEAGMASRIASSVLQVGTAALLGWAIWQGSKLALDRYAPAEEVEAEVSEDAMGKPGSRIATVMPVLRTFLFIAIVTIAALIALSSLGVDIGPLLAGAGVIGLAIGFGAQTLVKDIITGLFYLLEDAFRKGEYIQCSGGKGVVEKISLRSVQLRHHNGPVYTIPFSFMGTINNHSRDWVRIKFKIRVPFDTDLNLMRKVIKKVGKELEADPDLGPLFLQPIKSQGAVDTDDSGFITSVKFMSRPGEQFVLRREAFARIQKAFEENGIEFASRRVTVESEEGEDSREAVAAAAAAREQQSA